jgi:hypothetical protein
VKKAVPIIVELVGIFTVSMGIGLEIAFGGEPYLVMITVGSLLIAAGGIIWGKFLRQGGSR